VRTYEFTAIAKDGYIEIPAKYKNDITAVVKVTVVTEETSRSRKSDLFPYLGIDMSGYKFDRQEVNER
jgi:hypothetical protein